MNTTIKVEDDKYVVSFEGRLDTAAAPTAEKDLQTVTGGDPRDIILDCSALEYISSSGLRLFLSLLKTNKAKGKGVIIRQMNEEIRKVFAMTGFINLFSFE